MRSQAAWLLVLVAVMSGCAADEAPSATGGSSPPAATPSEVTAHGGCEWLWWDPALYTDLPSIADEADWSSQRDDGPGLAWPPAGARDGWPDPRILHVALATPETTFFLQGAPPAFGSLGSYTTTEGDPARVEEVARLLLSRYFDTPDEQAVQLTESFMSSATSGGPNGSVSRQVVVGRVLHIDRVWADLALDGVAPQSTPYSATFEAADGLGEWDVVIRFPTVTVRLPGDPAFDLVARGSGWIGASLVSTSHRTPPADGDVQRAITDRLGAAQASAPSFARWRSPSDC